MTAEAAVRAMTPRAKDTEAAGCSGSGEQLGSALESPGGTRLLTPRSQALATGAVTGHASVVLKPPVSGTIFNGFLT